MNQEDERQSDHWVRNIIFFTFAFVVFCIDYVPAVSILLSCHPILAVVRFASIALLLGAPFLNPIFSALPATWSETWDFAKQHWRPIAFFCAFLLTSVIGPTFLIAALATGALHWQIYVGVFAGTMLMGWGIKLLAKRVLAATHFQKFFADQEGHANDLRDGAWFAGICTFAVILFSAFFGFPEFWLLPAFCLFAVGGLIIGSHGYVTIRELGNIIIENTRPTGGTAAAAKDAGVAVGHGDKSGHNSAGILMMFGESIGCGAADDESGKRPAVPVGSARLVDYLDLAATCAADPQEAMSGLSSSPAV